MIRILVVEDNPIVLKGICQLLRAEPDFDVTGGAGDGFAAMGLLHNGLVPDVILSDLNMPGMDGFELTKRVTAFNPAIIIIILTMHLQVSYRHQAFAAGAKGYILKGEDEQELFNGIRAVCAGNIFISPGFTIML